MERRALLAVVALSLLAACSTPPPPTEPAPAAPRRPFAAYVPPVTASLEEIAPELSRRPREREVPPVSMRLPPLALEPRPAPGAVPAPPPDPTPALAERPAPVGRGTILVDSIPSGARVYVDGLSVGTTPMRAVVTQGSHRVFVHGPSGCKHQEVVVGGEPATVVVRTWD